MRIKENGGQHFASTGNQVPNKIKEWSKLCFCSESSTKIQIKERPRFCLCRKSSVGMKQKNGQDFASTGNQVPK